MSGCMCDFNIYEGKDGVQGKGLGHKVVTTLCEELYDKNYWIFCDNFFTSLSLSWKIYWKDKPLLVEL